MQRASNQNYTRFKKSKMSNFKTIKFSTNWNRKLDNIIFTTIRKQSHYVNNGDRVAIVLNDKLYKWAEVIAMSECVFSEVGQNLLMLDTGLLPDEALAVFKNMDIHRGPVPSPIKFIVLRTIVNPASDVSITFASKGTSQQKLEWE